MHTVLMLAQEFEEPFPAQDPGTGSPILVVFWIALIVLVFAAFWRIFTKASEPGWAVIVPIYNLYVILKITGRPWWWMLLFLIPFVGIVFAIINAVDLAKSFGKSGGFAVGLILLPFIFYPILGFGKAAYLGPAAARQAG